MLRRHARIAVPAGGPVRPAARLLAAAVFVATTATSALASTSEIRKAGERYAANDTRGALAILDEVVGRGGGTTWMAEALFLRAKIRQKDLGQRQAALRDLRLLTVHFAGTEVAPYGQFRLASIYEEMGLIAEAHREYTLCSRLRGFSGGKRTKVTGRFPALRMTPEGAETLVRLAAERAAVLHGRIPAPGATLAPRTFLATGPSSELEIPADPRAASVSGERSAAWYVVCPHGHRISGVAAEFEAAVDRAAAGPDAEKTYGLTVEPLPPRAAGGALALSGAMARPEKLSGRLAFAGGATVLRVTVRLSGARLLRCALKMEVRKGAASPPPPAVAPGGFGFAVAPSGRGVGGVALARSGKRLFLVWHSPGAGAPADPSADADIFLASSDDGTTWTAPVRLTVSSASDDREPSISAMPDGSLLLAWTSDRRGEGSSDVYLSRSPDGVTWPPPVRLGIERRDLDSMGPRMLSGGAGVPSAFLTLHRPAVSVDARGNARVFFVAHGTRYIKTGSRRTSKLGATGVYAMVSPDAKRWSKPVAIVSTPRTHLERYRPAPQTRDDEVVSKLSGPSVIERSPGRSIVGWVSTCGRVFLTQRDAAGEWAHHDTRFAGAAAPEGADDIELLGPVDDTYGVMLLRPDRAPKVVWRDKRAASGWSVVDVAGGAKPGFFSELAAVALEGGREWLAAWVGPGDGGPAGICVCRVPAPRPAAKKGP